jgi:hypothetical protein
MRKLFFLFATIIILSGVNAQDCSYYAMSKGMVLGYKSLDGKGKETGTTRTTCVDVENTGGIVYYKLKSEYADAKNANKSEHDLTFRCENGNFYMDMNSFLDPKSMEGFKDMELTVNADDMVYPSTLSIGQTLPDANITIAAASGGITIMNMVVSVTNRKVVGTESVTVPAGTFDCYKLTYDMETKVMFKITSSITEYVNMGVGSVKSEAYDKKGKLLSTTLLNELKR